MSWICLGALCVFLHIGVNLNGAPVVLNPDWLGYGLILLGMGQCPEAKAFHPAKKVLILGIAATLAVKLFAWTAALQGTAGFIFTACMEAAVVFFQLYACRAIINGIHEMERLYVVDLNYGLMIRVWWMLLGTMIFNAAMRLSGLSAIVPAMSYFMLIFVLAELAAKIVLLVALFRARKPFARAKAIYWKDREDAARMG